MPDNPHRIVIELAPSDGFHTRSNAHAAEIVWRRVTAEFGGDDLVRSVIIEFDKEGNT